MAKDLQLEASRVEAPARWRGEDPNQFLTYSQVSKLCCEDQNPCQTLSAIDNLQQVFA